MENVLLNSFEFLIHQFNSLNREIIHELWINSSIQPVSESYAQRFYHWGHAGVREIFRQQMLGHPVIFSNFWTIVSQTIAQSLLFRSAPLALAALLHYQFCFEDFWLTLKDWNYFNLVLLYIADFLYAYKFIGDFLLTCMPKPGIW